MRRCAFLFCDKSPRVWGGGGLHLNNHAESQPFVALIDDDQHSAHLLTRMLLAHGAPEIRWYGEANAGRASLAAALADATISWPAMVIIDLKAHSNANLEFITSIQPLIRQKGVLVVAMMHAADPAQRHALQQAGASAVFLRHAELDAYRREAASIVSFWARSQRLDAVGM